MGTKNKENNLKNDSNLDIPKFEIKPTEKVEIKQTNKVEITPTKIFDIKINENSSELFNKTTLNSINGIMHIPNYSRLLGSLGMYNNLDFRKLELYGESTTLRKKLETISSELSAEKEDKVLILEKKIELEKTNKELEKVNKELEKVNKEILTIQKRSHILSKINEKAQVLLLQESNSFVDKFNHGIVSEAVVLSIDIRRSTELMLKSRKPELYSKFITELSDKLSKNIKENFGVFDKFTGDGILAFFPKFYSGENAIIFALKAANECHKIFFEHYNNSRNCFNVFIKDIGLGIGIDFGNVTLVNNGSELTVVGIPVVYACRFSGAKAGDTLLNVPAFEEISEKCRNLFSHSEVELEIKNEGLATGYKILLNDGAFAELQDPIWE